MFLHCNVSGNYDSSISLHAKSKLQEVLCNRSFKVTKEVMQCATDSCCKVIIVLTCITSAQITSPRFAFQWFQLQNLTICALRCKLLIDHSNANSSLMFLFVQNNLWNWKSCQPCSFLQFYCNNFESEVFVTRRGSKVKWPRRACEDYNSSELSNRTINLKLFNESAVYTRKWRSVNGKTVDSVEREGLRICAYHMSVTAKLIEDYNDCAMRANHMNVRVQSFCIIICMCRSDIQILRTGYKKT